MIQIHLLASIRKCIHTEAKNAILKFKSLTIPEQKLNLIQEFVKKNLEISQISNALYKIMKISNHETAYRIFLIFISSGRKFDGINSECFDHVIKILVENKRMDKAERVISFRIILDHFRNEEIWADLFKTELY